MELANHFFLENDNAVNQGVNGRVSTNASVMTRSELAAMLAHNNLTLGNLLTPSRLEFESRPKLVLPPAFLCAIVHSLYFSTSGGDA